MGTCRRAVEQTFAARGRQRPHREGESLRKRIAATWDAAGSHSRPPRAAAVLGAPSSQQLVLCQGGRSVALPCSGAVSVMFVGANGTAEGCFNSHTLMLRSLAPLGGDSHQSA